MLILGNDSVGNLTSATSLKASAATPTGPNIFEAVREQLGLKLEERKTPGSLSPVKLVPNPVYLETKALPLSPPHPCDILVSVETDRHGFQSKLASFRIAL